MDNFHGHGGFHGRHLLESLSHVSQEVEQSKFILGVLFVPALVCFLFFAVFGASAIYLQDHHIANIAKAATGQLHLQR